MPHRKPITDAHTARARELRHDSTFPEKLLWSRLRDRRLAGIKFRRQFPVESYVVDYYCDEARLVIELDGDSHADRAAYDADRTAALQKARFRVIRIANDDVLKDLDAVLEFIKRECGK